MIQKEMIQKGLELIPQELESTDTDTDPDTDTDTDTKWTKLSKNRVK